VPFGIRPEVLLMANALLSGELNWRLFCWFLAKQVTV